MNLKDIINSKMSVVAGSMGVHPMKFVYHDTKESAEIEIDGPFDISVKTCAEFSRALQDLLLNENIDISITVSSHGAYAPLSEKFQFEKNIGRVIYVKLKNGKEHEGTLKSVQNDSILLEVKERIPKEKGKGKISLFLEHLIPLKDLQLAKVKPIF